MFSVCHSNIYFISSGPLCKSFYAEYSWSRSEQIKEKRGKLELRHKQLYNKGKHRFSVQYEKQQQQQNTFEINCCEL